MPQCMNCNTGITKCYNTQGLCDTCDKRLGVLGGCRECDSKLGIVGIGDYIMCTMCWIHTKLELEQRRAGDIYERENREAKRRSVRSEACVLLVKSQDICQSCGQTIHDQGCGC